MLPPTCNVELPSCPEKTAHPIPQTMRVAPSIPPFDKHAVVSPVQCSVKSAGCGWKGLLCASMLARTKESVDVTAEKKAEKKDVQNACCSLSHKSSQHG
ncbi:uncharacterized protein BKA78DRAFT_321806 [Phyllosticta capitalensis]|uniref:uncharacterized protein n=1 Tax=Phyllosticta capitalensis TaxID=121624 RepID=UPI00312D57F2